MVNVGILGLGPAWESRYCPVLKKLRGRIHVCAVYDPVASRAELAAADFQADPMQGILALLDHRAVQAVILLGSDWQGHVPLSFLLERRKPVYISGGLGENLHRLHQLHQAATADGLTMMPEFSWRYTPATGRLQELLATRLGRPQRILIDAVAPRPEDPQIVPGQGPGIDFLVGLFDWCRYVLRTPPLRLQASRSAGFQPASPAEQPTGQAGSLPYGEGEGHSIVVEFRQPATVHEPPVAELRIVRPASVESERSIVRFQVVCERGEAVLDSAAQISWTAESGAAAESLVSERSTVEVMLDHFCRRAVGGLIPLADIADACHGIRLAKAVEQSLRTGEPISLNGRDVAPDK